MRLWQLSAFGLSQLHIMLLDLEFMICLHHPDDAVLLQRLPTSTSTLTAESMHSWSSTLLGELKLTCSTLSHVDYLDQLKSTSFCKSLSCLRLHQFYARWHSLQLS